MTYNVFDQERAERVRSFCDTAIPLADGKTPSDSDFDRITEAAQGSLEEAIADSLAAAIEQVREEIARPREQGYQTGPVVEAVGDACGRYDLYSIGAIS